MKFDESGDLVHRDFMHLGVLDQPVRPQKCKITTKRGSSRVSYVFFFFFSQLNARIIAASDEKDLYESITRFNNMVRGST